MPPKAIASQNTDADASVQASAGPRPSASHVLRSRRVLVTRPARDAGPWVEQLQRLGFAAEALPLIEIAPVSEPQHVSALNAAWRALPNYSACMFVSGNAVEHFFRQKVALVQAVIAPAAIENIAKTITAADLPTTLRCLAPGPGTTAALLSAGVAASQIDAPPDNAEQFDSEALWQVIGGRNWQGCKVLVVRGLTAGLGNVGASSGRDWLSQRFQEAGATVDAVAAYQRRAPVFDANQFQRMQTALADGAIWIFSSSEAVSNMMAAAGVGGLQLGAGEAQTAVALATHPRIAESLRQQGWASVIETRPALGDVAAALAALMRV